MKTTLDGKQAGLQDARQLKKELSDLKMKEDAVFSKVGLNLIVDLRGFILNFTYDH
jgi:hypothetical protein